MDWFRMYVGARNDARLRTLSAEAFRVWFKLLCFSAEQKTNRGTIPDVYLPILAVEVAEGDQDLLQAALVEMQALHLISATNGNITILNPAFESLTPNRPPADTWRELRSAVFSRDDYTCQYCGARGVSLQCDHIFPVSRGGSNDPENLATACKSCNQSKHNKTPEEWQR